MKVESDTDALNEVHSVGMNSNEVYVPSEIALIKAESEVSLVSGSFFIVLLVIQMCVWLYVHSCFLCGLFCDIELSVLKCIVLCDVMSCSILEI